MSSAKNCIVRLDRVQFLAWPRTDRLPDIPGFVVRRDTFVRQQTTVKTYGRARTYKNQKTKTTAYVQHRRARPWLAPAKVTLTAEGHKGLCRSDFESIVRAFRKVRLLLVELAVDFKSESGVDRSFVLAHGVFGRSHRRAGGFYADLRFGSRKSDKLVRCYQKSELALYRVELELHSPWLRKHRINTLHDLERLPALVFPAHLRFVRLDWVRLATYVRRHGLPAETVPLEAKVRASSILAVMGYLRQEVGLPNIHRFLRPLPLNADVEWALRKWSERWKCAGHG